MTELIEMDLPKQGGQRMTFSRDPLTERLHARGQFDLSRLAVHDVHHRGDGVLHEIMIDSPSLVGLIGLVARLVLIQHAISDHAGCRRQVGDAGVLDDALAIIGIAHLLPVFDEQVVERVLFTDGHYWPPVTTSITGGCTVPRMES